MTTRILSLLLAALFIPGTVLGQATLMGVVTDNDTDEPLPGANVTLEELNRGAATDVNGQYQIEDVEPGTYTVTVSFVGYKELQEQIEIDPGENEYNPALNPDIAGMDEIVVTGIASRTSRARSEVAVSNVNADELQETSSYQDVTQLMNGKISGVTVQPASGQVGSGIRFNVRSSVGLSGDGQPVIYVDGVRIDNSEVEGLATGGQGVSMLSNLNPDEIENIEMLKGPAAAALYGTSGSNGVVLITTKRGSAEQPMSVRYKGVLGYNDQIQEYDLSTSPTPDVANSFFRQGDIYEHGLSISGGSDIVRYFASYNTRGEEGTLPNNELDRNSFRANFEAYPLENVTVRVKSGYTQNGVTRPQNDNNIYGYIGNTTISTSPFVFTDSSAIEGVENIQRTNTFTGSVEGSYTPWEGVEFQASIGYQGGELRNDETYPADEAYQTVTNGLRAIYERRNEQMTYDINGRYNYGFLNGDLNASTILGFQAFDLTRRTFDVEKQNFSTSLITNVGAGADFITAGEGFTDRREAGIFAQQELSYQQTAFLSLGLRRDFATAIGSEAPSIFYPKASFALRLDRFGFMPSYANLFKLRTAYGETGQLPSLNDAVRFLYEAEPSGYGAGAVLDFIGNPEIEPERVREFELGLDAELFERTSLALTYYQQYARGSIIDFEAAPSTGLVASAIPFNVGRVDGQGLEADLTVTPFRTRDFTLDLSAIYSYQTNEVKDLGGAQPIYGGFDNNVTKEGLPKGAFYIYTSEAQFNEDGTFEVVPGKTDEQGNPVREFLGTPYPDHNGSFSLNLRLFQNFSVYALLDWASGLNVQNGTKRFQVLFAANRDRNIAAYQLGLSPYSGLPDDVLQANNLGYLTEYESGGLEPGTDAYREAAQTYASLATSVAGVGTRGNFTEEADYAKLREITVSYDFSDLLNNLGPIGNDYIQSLSFSLSARNIWTWTEYSGVDPEVNFTGARGRIRSQDFLTLASPRTIYGTLNVRF